MSRIEEKTCTFNDLGGKSRGLSILSDLGYRVPEYFVVKFSQDINDQEFTNELNIFTKKFKSFAIRSSANIEDGKNTSFAGQFKSFLDVPANEIKRRIEDVRKSTKTESVKKYCEATGIAADSIKMNVIIQRFEEPFIGGVWMGNSILGGRLEWVEGRGDKVVNGESIPFFESYDTNGQLQDKNTNQVLAEKSGQSISKLCLELQSKLGYDADIEFCITEEGVQWLQLRRVTRDTGEHLHSLKSHSQIKIISGEAASPHTSQGIAYRLDQKQGAEWGSEKILVARATSPNDMMYIMTSKGVVTKMGGMLSHAAVVCRELSIACVVGVDIDKIEHGKEVYVDGKLGEIHLL